MDSYSHRNGKSKLCTGSLKRSVKDSIRHFSLNFARGTSKIKVNNKILRVVFNTPDADFFLDFSPAKGIDSKKQTLSGFIVKASSSWYNYFAFPVEMKKTLDAALELSCSRGNSSLVSKLEYDSSVNIKHMIEDKPPLAVYVNTFGNHNKSLKKYRILPSKQGVSLYDLEFQEYAAKIEEVLSARGLSRVETNPDVLIFLNYGISTPIVDKNTYSRPVYGLSITSPKNTTFKSSSGSVLGYATSGSWGIENNYMGQKTETVTTVTFKRVIQIEAVKPSSLKGKNKRNVEFYWKTIIESSGKSNDLRYLFPRIIDTVEKYIGTNTRKKIKVVTDDSQEKVF